MLLLAREVEEELAFRVSAGFASDIFEILPICSCDGVHRSALARVLRLDGG